MRNNRHYAALRVFSEKLALKEIVDAIDELPDVSHDVGDVVSSLSGGRRKESMWMKKTHEFESSNVNDSLGEVSKFIILKSESIEYLKIKGAVIDVVLFYSSNYESCELVINSRNMSIISGVGIELWCDVYLGGEA